MRESKNPARAAAEPVLLRLGYENGQGRGDGHQIAALRLRRISAAPPHTKPPFAPVYAGTGGFADGSAQDGKIHGGEGRIGKGPRLLEGTALLTGRDQ